MTIDTSREAIDRMTGMWGVGVEPNMARVTEVLTALASERDEALAREAVLREALEPFSDAAGNMDKYDPLRLPDKGYLAFGMRYGHLRAAQVFVAALGASTAAAAAARDAALRMEATGDEMSVLHMAPHDGEIIRLRAENATLTDCLGHILIAIHDDSDVRRKLGDDEATERAVARWYSLRTENERLTAIVTDDNGPWRLEAAKKRIAELEDRHADLAARAADLTLKAQAVAKADRAALTHRVAEAVREACAAVAATHLAVRPSPTTTSPRTPETIKPLWRQQRSFTMKSSQSTPPRSWPPRSRRMGSDGDGTGKRGVLAHPRRDASSRCQGQGAVRGGYADGRHARGDRGRSGGRP